MATDTEGSEPTQLCQNLDVGSQEEVKESDTESSYESCEDPDDILPVKLDRLLITDSIENEVIIDWLAASVYAQKAEETDFIRALVSSVCSSAIESADSGYRCNSGTIVKRAMLLRRFLKRDVRLQLEALSVLQEKIHHIKHPAGLLQSFYDVLYDEDVISEEAFNRWATSESKQDGQQTAVDSVQGFLSWLHETEEE